MNNKKHVLIIVLSILFVMIITVVLNVIFSTSWKKYEISSIQNDMFRFYSDRGLRTMDFVDMTGLFGINLDNLDEDSMYLTNYNIEDDINSEFMLIVVINTDDPTYYYDIFNSHLDSYMMYSEDEELIKLYEKAVLVEGDNFIYFIIDKDASMIEKEINMYYK